jgi:3-oxoacyl-[acyl-carrier protein] reductase
MTSFEEAARFGTPSLQDLLSGRVAVVTGGTRGIGRAICERFVEAGASVVALGREAQPGENQSDQVGLRCDVADEDSVAQAFAHVMRTYGRVDILVNNAGITIDGLIHRGELADFRSVVDVNLQGTWLCTREALRVMRTVGAGSIVNIASISGKVGNVGQGAYAASKAAVVALTKTTAREGSRHGIRANAIRPGLISTDMTAALAPDAWREKLESIPLARAGEPREVADAALFLASDLASYVTGAVLDVAGGREM